MIVYSNLRLNIESDLCENINELVPKNAMVELKLSDFNVPYMSVISTGMNVDWNYLSNILLKQYNIHHTIFTNGTGALRHRFYRLPSRNEQIAKLEQQLVEAEALVKTYKAELKTLREEDVILKDDTLSKKIRTEGYKRGGK